MTTSKIPQAPSLGEKTFELHCRVNKLTPEREYRFCRDRQWRLDFAWPDVKLAVEIESSVHRIKSRFASDLDKYNRLTLEGWKLLRFTRKMVETGQPILTVMELLGACAHLKEDSCAKASR